MNNLKKIINTFPCYNLIMSSERCYGRWMHRQPSKVILPYAGSSMRKEKVIELDSKEMTQPKDLDHKTKDKQAQNEHLKSEVKSSNKVLEKSKEIKKKRETKVVNIKEKINSLKVFDENNNLIYQKLKENDGRISSLLVSLKSKKERTRMGQVLVEGWRLIMDGIEAKCKLTHVIFSRTEDLDKLKPYLPKAGVRIYKIPYKEITLWSDVETSPGIMGVFETPTPENVKRLSKPFPINLVCDNIRVPGNLGSVLRSAVGVGCDNVFLMKGCVDLWDPKVIRSAAGAHFRLPVYTSVKWKELTELIDSETSVFVADNKSNSIDVSTENNVENLSNVDIPVLPYYSVDYSTLQSVTLIIGGETEGISEECYRFTADKNGLRLNIPLQKGVDSLNSAMATAIIAFEIKKQMLEADVNDKFIKDIVTSQ